MFWKSFFLFSLITLNTWAEPVCEIKTFSTIIYSKDNNGATDKLIHNSNCPSKIVKTFSDIILNFQNEIRATYLETAFQKEFAPYSVKISPPKIKISRLETFINKNTNLIKEMKFTNAKILSRKKLITLNSNETISIDCKNCQTTGEKNIELTIYNSTTSTSKKEWIIGNIVTTTRALVAKKHLGVTHVGLFANDFHFKKIKTMTPGRFFQDSKHITFYKLNKPVQKNIPLAISDLSPINLVTAGTKAHIIFKNSSLNLTGTAIPITSGKYGDIIKLRRANGKREITGKIVNFNKVLVTL